MDKQPDRFRLDPVHLRSGLNTLVRVPDVKESRERSFCEVESQLTEILHRLIQRSGFLALEDGPVKSLKRRNAQEIPNLFQACCGLVKKMLIFDYEQIGRRE
ncbi:hypothetical protein ACVILI_006629 [Mesorhizobium sp. USDA 4775]